MSGVVAVVDPERSDHLSSVLAGMVEGQRYRGEARTWAEGEVALAAQRVNKTPVLAVSDDLVLAADGRPHDRDHLARRLGVADDERPAELLLAAWRRWGERLFDHVLGEVSLVVWNRRTGALTALADPMGLRPLHLRVSAGTTTIATDISALAGHPTWSPDLDRSAATRHLAGGVEQGTETLFADVDRLPPGHVVMATGTRTPAPRQVWSFELRDEDSSADDAADRFGDELVRAVGRRLDIVSPAALLLSGGPDSGGIAIAAGSRTAALTAYQFAFDELPECDERHLSGPLAAHLGLPAATVRADDAGPLAGFPHHAPPLDHPYVGAFQPALDRALATARADGARSMFSGDRGDLLVGDAVWDLRGLARARRWSDLRHDLDLLRARTGRSLARAAAVQLVAPSIPRPDRFPTPPPWLHPVGSDELRSTETHLHGRQGRLDLITGDEPMRIAAWSSRTYARHGLEFLDPYADRALVDLVLQVPGWRVQRPGSPKALLRDALSRLAPAAPVRAMTKISPEALFDRDLRAHRTAVVEELLHDMAAEDRGLIDGPSLRSAWREIAAGAEIGPAFWSALTLEWWLREHWS